MDEIITTIVLGLFVLPPLAFLAKTAGEWVAKKKIKKIWRGKYR